MGKKKLLSINMKLFSINMKLFSIYIGRKKNKKLSIQVKKWYNELFGFPLYFKGFRPL